MSFMKGAMLLLLLAAVSTNADDCGALNKTIPASDLHKVYGDWALVWSVADKQEGWDLLVNLSSSHVELRHLPDSNSISFLEGNMFADKSCNTYDIKMAMPAEPEETTLHASSALLGKDGVWTQYNESGSAQFFETSENSTLLVYTSDKVRYMLFYKTKGHHHDVEKMKEDLESHKKMAECLGFPQEVVFTYDGAAEFCPMMSPPGPATPEPHLPGPATPEPHLPEVVTPEPHLPESS